MVDSMISFLSDTDNRVLAEELEDIYISAYTQDDVGTVKDALARRLPQIGNP